MGQLSGFSYQQVIKKLTKAGFFLFRQAKGSHEIWQNPNDKIKITIPKHKTIKEGTLRVIVKQANLSVQQFLEL